MKPVVDWNDIYASVRKELGDHRAGWADQLALVLEDVKRSVERHPDVFGDELPDVQQIKQKLGGLRVYTRKCNQNLLDELDARIDEIERTYEKCGNAAQVQSIQGYLTTLCCWCYNDYLEDRFEGAEAKWPTDLKLDIADRFPDLVSADTASLKPSIGAGWLVLLGQFLQATEHVVRKAFKEPFVVQITDVKMSREGSIHIDFSKFDHCLDQLLRRIDLDSKRTCAKCGHKGDIVRKKDKASVLCAHCEGRGEWDPFNE
ncbi:hypothetical protein [Ruegeria sp. HKCCA6837]|uniref:hypothetical protein n=1 Tax=Ruegeria sp. HKCCA6837 TaxID=2682989 RepID=UPI001488DF92|nr:hypothetical protein [Ruegeria sp. HKCCA6837]